MDLKLRWFEALTQNNAARLNYGAVTPFTIKISRRTKFHLARWVSKGATMLRTSTLLGALGVIGAGAAVSYAFFKRQPAALATAGAKPPPDVRDAGPDAMANPPRRWDPVDQQADESFPASDPPGNY
jgi:hypothetical protein